MDLEQRAARNEALQLLAIAHRILTDAGLTAYAGEVGLTVAGMKCDARMLLEQERRRVNA